MREFRIYKPRKEGNGAASEFRVGEYKDNPVLNMALVKQDPATGEKGTFLWKDESKVTVKVDPHEVADMIAVFEAQKKQLGFGEKGGLYHQGQGQAYSAINLATMDNGGYLLSVRKGVKGGQSHELKHSLTLAEGVLLREYLKLYLHTFFTSQEPWKKRADAARNGSSNGNDNGRRNDPEPAVVGNDDDHIPF
jgi:hypothetical protein